MPNRSTREGANRAGRLAAVVLFPITALASWCLIGPSTEGSDPSTTYDYIVRAPEMNRGVEIAVGGVAAIGVIVAGSLFLKARRPASLARCWRGAAAWSLVSGLALGAGGRVVTAGTIGANIGGGLLILVLPPILLTGWIVAIGCLVQSGRRSQRQQDL